MDLRIGYRRFPIPLPNAVNVFFTKALRDHGLLWLVFQAIIFNRLAYALPWVVLLLMNF